MTHWAVSNVATQMDAILVHLALRLLFCGEKKSKVVSPLKGYFNLVKWWWIARICHPFIIGGSVWLLRLPLILRMKILQHWCSTVSPSNQVNGAGFSSLHSKIAGSEGENLWLPQVSYWAMFESKVLHVIGNTGSGHCLLLEGSHPVDYCPQAGTWQWPSLSVVEVSQDISIDGLSSK